MDNGIGLTTQGEYIHTSYSQQPTPPPPAPWYLPQPPTSHHTRQQTHHLPPYRWYNPPEPRYKPQRAQSHPRTRPPPKRHPRFENRTGHVTATVFGQQNVPHLMDHLGTCHQHSEKPKGPPGGLACPLPAVSKGAGILHPILTPWPKTPNTRTVRIGARPALTALLHSEIPHHLLSHHQLLLLACYTPPKHSLHP
jgi:hypothetical protein